MNSRSIRERAMECEIDDETEESRPVVNHFRRRRNVTCQTQEKYGFRVWASFNFSFREVSRSSEHCNARNVAGGGLFVMLRTPREHRFNLITPCCLLCKRTYLDNAALSYSVSPKPWIHPVCVRIAYVSSSTRMPRWHCSYECLRLEKSEVG